MVSNKLNILILSQKMALMNKGENVKIRDIEESIAKSCEVSRETIVSIKSGRVLPSLPVALKLSKYFDVTVNDIFELGDE